MSSPCSRALRGDGGGFGGAETISAFVEGEGEYYAGLITPERVLGIASDLQEWTNASLLEHLPDRAPYESVEKGLEALR